MGKIKHTWLPTHLCSRTQYSLVQVINKDNEIIGSSNGKKEKYTLSHTSVAERERERERERETDR